MAPDGSIAIKFFYAMINLCYIMNSMYCKACNTEKPDSEFPNNRSKISGKGSACNDCMYERVKEWRRSNRLKVRDQNKRYYDKRFSKGDIS